MLETKIDFWKISEKELRSIGYDKIEVAIERQNPKKILEALASLYNFPEQTTIYEITNNLCRAIHPDNKNNSFPDIEVKKTGKDQYSIRYNTRLVKQLPISKIKEYLGVEN